MQAAQEGKEAATVLYALILDVTHRHVLHILFIINVSPSPAHT